MDDFYTFLENMGFQSFVGDFNINFYDTHQSLYHKLDNIMSTFSLTQFVKDPTHINHSDEYIIVSHGADPSRVVC